MGRALGSQYSLDELLGAGAMGQVYRGSNREGRLFAFKLLRSDLVEDAEFVSRFHQERSILVNLRGENLVAVHDLVVEGNTAAIVMDLVSGGTLRDQLLASGPILPAEVARIGSGIARALHDVHVAGIVHRDVKPENVLMDTDGPVRVPKLTDFGVSKMVSGSKLGRSTLLAGTPQYVAPELADGREVTPAADLYSLGIVLYEMCCGVTPFASESVFQVLRSHGELMPGRPDGIPDELWEIIWSLLQKNPAARPRPAGQVATALEVLSQRFWQAGHPVAPKLTAPPRAVPPARGNDNETVLRTSPRAAPSGPGRKSRKRVVLALVSTVALLCAAGGGAYYLASTRSADPPPQSTPAADATDAKGAPLDDGGATVVTTTEIELVTMPDLVGLSLGEARDKLPQSMDVRIVEQVDESSPDGTVLSQKPAAGEDVADATELVVARPAVTVYLDSVPPSAGQWSSSGEAFTVGMGGKQYLHALGTQVSSYCTSDPEVVEYNLSRGFRRLVAAAGIGDDSEDSEMVIQLEIFGDGRLIASESVKFGAVVDLDIDLTNVLRLKLQWVVTSDLDYCRDNVFALGDAKLLGLASEVPTSGVPPASESTPATTSTTG